MLPATLKRGIQILESTDIRLVEKKLDQFEQPLTKLITVTVDYGDVRLFSPDLQVEHIAEDPRMLRVESQAAWMSCS